MSIARNKWRASEWVRRGFSLVEVTVAMAICVFVLVALFALLQAGLLQHRQSIDESLAINLSGMLVQDLRLGAVHTNTNYVASTNFGLPLTNGGIGQVYLTESGAKTTSPVTAKFLVKTKISTDDDINGKGRRAVITFWPPHAGASSPLAEVVVALKSASTNF